MSNPLAIAIQGKGGPAFLRRARAIIGRYGLSAAKMGRNLASFVGTLEEFGCQATLPVTATAAARRIAIVKMYAARGVEFAVHGLAHVDYTRLSLDEQQTHLERSRRIFEQAGLRVAGFRCPYLRWNADLLTALARCGFEYDSSPALAWDVTGGLDTAAYRRVLGFYGARAAKDYPALPRLEGELVRIPYSLPDDEALVERLQLTRGEAMAEIWLELLEKTYAAGELFTLGLHPERAAVCRYPLRATLERARALSPRVWIARLDEIAAWQRALAQTTFQASPEADGRLRLTITAATTATPVARGVQIEAPTHPWGAADYLQIAATEFYVRSNKRPFIGLSPDTPLALRAFLRQQGYLAEVSAEGRDYPLHIQQTRFDQEDERTLLTQVEREGRPLVRLARWPGGAQSALSVTGDIDAFTLGDYAARALGG